MFTGGIKIVQSVAYFTCRLRPPVFGGAREVVARVTNGTSTTLAQAAGIFVVQHHIVSVVPATSTAAAGPFIQPPVGGARGALLFLGIRGAAAGTKALRAPC